jgi:hypothetical protein
MQSTYLGAVRTRRELNAVAAGAVGVVFVVVGILGFAVSGGHQAIGHEGGELGLFQVNTLHNVVHIAVGAALVLAAWFSNRAARVGNVAIGAVYLALGAGGMFILGDTPLNIIALNGADNWLHIAGGAALVAVGLFADRRTLTLAERE